MQTKLLLLAIGLLAFTAGNASGKDPSPCKGKKDELNGTVITAESKRPLKDVTITAILVTKNEKTVVTDEGGAYAFDELKPGTYTFVFEKAGFKKVTREKIVVKTDETFQMNIEMTERVRYELMPSPLHFSEF